MRTRSEERLGLFLTDLPRFQPYQGKYVRILDDIKYQDKNGRIHLTPAGWVLDGCSMPLFMQWKWSPFDPRYIRSAGIHDVRFCAHDLTFKDSNKLFRECLDSEQWEYAKLFAWAVGTPFGWYSYNLIDNMPVNEPLLEVVRKHNEDQDAILRIRSLGVCCGMCK